MTGSIKQLAVCALLLVSATFAAAQSVNDGFNPNANDRVQSLAVQADGKVVAGGSFTDIGGQSRNRIARVNVDGSVDTAFNPAAGANDSVASVAVQADGKVLLGGDFTQVGGQPRNRIARLNANGSLDSSFNPADGANGNVHTLALQSDGKLLIGGEFTEIGGQARNSLARLNGDGSIDASFNPSGNDVLKVKSLAVQTDGKVLVGGDFGLVGGVVRNRIARLNADGSVDASFNAADGPSALVNSVAVQPDGKVLIGGEFTHISGQPRNYIGRLNADGSLDAGFNPVGGADGFVFSLALQPDGKVVVGGGFTQIGGQTRNHIARLNADGSVDASYNPTGGSNGIVSALAAQADGNVLVGGAFSQIGGQARNRIARLNADGSVDTSLNTANNPNSWVGSVAVRPDGKLLVGGDFTQIGGVARGRIARLNADGSVDIGFTPDPANRVVVTVTALPDGKVLITGEFTQIGTAARNRIARLNADGSLDASFYPPGGANNFIYAAAVQPDGKVIVGGDFTTIGGVTRNRIARLNADGSLDTGFNPDAGGGVVRALALQPDGTVLIGGAFTSIGGITRNRIARLNAGGNLDANFYPTGGANSIVYSLAVQPDGKVLAGGTFTTIGGLTRNHIARLNTDGTVDTDFYPAGGAGGGEVLSIAVQTNGKILAGGYFTTMGGVPRNRIARLNADGGVDSFYPTSGANDAVLGLAMQTDGKVLVGGVFSQVGGQPRKGFARLSMPEAAPQLLDVGADRASVQWLRSGSGPELQRAWFERSDDGTTWSAIGEGARIAGGWSLGGLSLPRNQNLWLRGRGEVRGGAYNASGSLIESVRQVYLRTFTVTASVEGQGTVAVTTPTVDFGAAAGFTVTPGAGWHLVSLIGDTCTLADNGDGSWTALNISADCAVTATFAIDTWTLTYAAGIHGTLSGASPQTVDHGTDGTPVTAVADTGYSFVEWSDGSTTNPRTDSNVTSDISVSASFAINRNTVMASASANGAITPPSQTVDHGAAASFTVTPAANHHVVAVSGDTCTPVHGSGRDWSAANITADCAVTATFAIDTYAVTATADANGTITPPTQTVDHGAAAGFTVTPAANHHIVAVSGDTCTPVHGSGSNWSAANITADCAVTATFAIDTYAVTATADANGAITPPTQSVDHGGAASFTVTPAANHHVVAVSGDTCTPVHDSGDSWSAANITAACVVTATFAIDTWMVTATAGANGTITPATQSVAHGETAGVMVTPAAGYHVASVDGDACTLTHAGGASWISGPITADCAIVATFAADPADLLLTIDDGRTYVRYGQLLTYVVTLSNRGTSAANTVSIAMDLPPQLDADYSRWICLGAGAGATCSAAGEGALRDDGVAIPPGRSLTWLVTAPVRLDAAGDAVDATVSASAGAHSVSAGDRTTLVILRDSFDVRYSDGTQGDGRFAAPTPCGADAAEALDATFLRSFTLAPAAGMFDTVLAARGDDGAGFRVERVTLGGAHLRLVTTAPNGAEHASAWVPVELGATLALATAEAADGQRVLLLEGAAAPLSAPLPAGMADRMRIQIQEDGGCH